MNIRIIPAYEPVSSTTIRLTPEDIGEILSRCNDIELKKVLSELNRITELYSPDYLKEMISWAVCKAGKFVPYAKCLAKALLSSFPLRDKEMSICPL